MNMYVRWALQAPILLAFYIFCYMTCWLWAGIAATWKLDALPGPMSWVHTHDDTIYGDGWLASNGYEHPKTWFTRWKTAMWWICRNPAYGFAAKVLGFADEDVDHIVELKRIDGPYAELDAIIYMKDGSTRFSWKKQRKLKIWIGWQRWNQNGWHIMKFNISPNPDD